MWRLYCVSIHAWIESEMWLCLGVGIREQTLHEVAKAEKACVKAAKSRLQRAEKKAHVVIKDATKRYTCCSLNLRRGCLAELTVV